MGYLAEEGNVACDELASAGGIPVIVQFFARFPDDKQVMNAAFRALITLSTLSDKPAKATLPTIIANVRAHPTHIGYEFLLKHMHHYRTAFFECEVGAEVYGIAVSYKA